MLIYRVLIIINFLFIGGSCVQATTFIPDDDAELISLRSSPPLSPNTSLDEIFEDIDKKEQKKSFLDFKNKEEINIFLENMLYPEPTVTIHITEDDKSIEKEHMMCSDHEQEIIRLPSFPKQSYLPLETHEDQKENQSVEHHNYDLSHRSLQHASSIVLSEEVDADIEKEDISTQTRDYEVSLDRFQINYPLRGILKGFIRLTNLAGALLFATPVALEKMDVTCHPWMWQLAGGVMFCSSLYASKKMDAYDQEERQDIEDRFVGKTVVLTPSRAH